MKASERLHLREAVKLNSNVPWERRSRLMAIVLSVRRRLEKGHTLLVFCVDNSCHRALGVGRKSFEGSSTKHLETKKSASIKRPIERGVECSCRILEV